MNKVINVLHVIQKMHLFKGLEPHKAHLFEKVCNAKNELCKLVSLHSKALRLHIFKSSRANLNFCKVSQ